MRHIDARNDVVVVMVERNAYVPQDGASVCLGGSLESADALTRVADIIRRWPQRAGVRQTVSS